MSTASELIDAVEAELKDTGNVHWSVAELTQHLRRALRAYSRVSPQRKAATVQSVADAREYDISSACSGYMEIVDVWYPYDASDPQYPPERVAWSMLIDDILFLDVTDAPSGDAADDIRIIYTAPHEIEGLDSAAATTLDAQGEQAVILGASGYAALQYAQSLMGTVTVSGWTPRQFQDWSEIRLRQFDQLLGQLRQRAVLAQDARVLHAEAV
ncbi:MAG: hypothetical protein JXA74_17230 [Anaerolineae bacterium]|nr:hypothetical protein [Anaerolineae bacterium]